jgi:hypothetical protein
MMLLDLALRSGWRPAGASQPNHEEEYAAEEDDAPPALELDASDHEIPREHPVAQAVASLFPSGDAVRNSYFFNDGRRVAAEDARAQTDALEWALPDVPDHDAMEEKTFFHPGLPGVRLVDARTPVNPFEWFSGKKDILLDFIGYCRLGGFEIW